MDIRKGDRVRITTEFTVTRVDGSRLYFGGGDYRTFAIDYLDPNVIRKVEVVEQSTQVGDILILKEAPKEEYKILFIDEKGGYLLQPQGIYVNNTTPYYTNHRYLYELKTKESAPSAV